LPHHHKVKGLSPIIAAGSGREEMAKKQTERAWSLRLKHKELTITFGKIWKTEGDIYLRLRIFSHHEHQQLFPAHSG
jgi:hypothetical protein